jgi:uncharacterized membrane protein required for colicin V production|tara:strand:+ start:106 stop:633 length:528 start_codon:yes stop_codon:yes gene_type:complete
MEFFLDGFAIVVILLWGYVGFKNGFIEELGRLLGLVTAVLISISNSSRLSITLSDFFSIDQWLSTFLSFSSFFIFTIFLFRILTKLVKIAFLTEGSELINKILGFFFGAIKGGGILIVLVWFIAILPLKKWTNFIQDYSELAKQGNQFRIGLVSFFNWEDPITVSESYIKKVTQP